MSGRAVLAITFHGYWHCGTGRGGGASLDAVVARCDAGLPTVPGRTLRGLLRDGVRRAAACGQLDGLDWETALFGTALGGPPADAEDETQRRGTTPGRLAVGSALLGEDLRSYMRSLGSVEATKLAGTLFESLGQTAIDESGTAQRRSLRVIEVAVPLQLTATLELLPGYGRDSRVEKNVAESWVEALKAAAPFVGSIGAHRQRGLGRCSLEVGKAA